jgi:hypothetical protein
MAVDILLIPAMSASAERLFSSAGLTISDRRYRLGIDVIEAIECLKSWLSLDEWVEDHEYLEKVEFDGKPMDITVGEIEIMVGDENS